MLESFRFFVDFNNTLYMNKGEPIASTLNPLGNSDLDLMDELSGDIYQQVLRTRDDQRKEKRAFVPAGFTNEIFPQSHSKYLDGSELDPIQERGLRLLSNCVDLYGRRPLVTVLSNMPLIRYRLLMHKLREDQVDRYLDRDLPVLLRPNGSIHPALFKLAAVSLYPNCLLIDDDRYIGRVIRAAYPSVEVFNPLPESQAKSQPEFLLPGRYTNLNGRDIEPYYNLGIEDACMRLIERGQLKFNPSVKEEYFGISQL